MISWIILWVISSASFSLSKKSVLELVTGSALLQGCSCMCHLLSFLGILSMILIKINTLNTSGTLLSTPYILAKCFYGDEWWNSEILCIAHLYRVLQSRTLMMVALNTGSDNELHQSMITPQFALTTWVIKYHKWAGFQD